MSERVFVDYVRDGTGGGVDGALAEIKHGSPPTTLDSMTTGPDGKIEFTRADIGYPGATWIEASKDGTTRKHTGESIGQVGAVWMADFIRLFRVMTDGVFAGIENDLEVTADNSGMHVDVATGFAIGYGLPYYQSLAKEVAIGANGTGNPRIDLIVVRYYPDTTTDDTDVGRIDLLAVVGTPAGSPVAPTITQDPTTYWEVPLAQVRVNAGVSAIAADKVTDVRVFSSGPLMDASVTTAKMANLAVTSAKIANATIGVGKLTAGASVSTTDLIQVMKAPTAGDPSAPAPAFGSIAFGQLSDVANIAATANQVPVWNAGTGMWTPGSAASGDASTNTATSVDGEAVLFSGTTGKILRRSTLSGMIKSTAGVLSAGTAGTDYSTASATETLTNKTFNANGTGNAITNLEVADLAAGVLDTDLSSVAATDTTIPSAKATKAALDGKSAITHTHMGNPTVMARPAIAAAGPFSSGSHDLYDANPFTLLSGVTYNVEVMVAVETKNDGVSGTFNMTITLDGTTSTPRTFQTVGGVPHECTWTTFKEITGTGSTVNITVTIGTITGDATNFRTGYVFVRAHPQNIPAS